MKNRIETPAQLAMQYDAVQAEMDALTDYRRDLYRQRRQERDNEPLSGEISNITTKLRALRRELKLCARIEGDVPRVQASVRERSITLEKLITADLSAVLRLIPTYQPVSAARIEQSVAALRRCEHTDYLFLNRRERHVQLITKRMTRQTRYCSILELIQYLKTGR